MGTRADFYLGSGPDAEWLGSVAWDGDAWEKSTSWLRKAKTKSEFLKKIAKIAKRDDFTSPEQGWPWPWSNSNTTDVIYYFEKCKVKLGGRRSDWSDMSSRMKVATGERSGLFVISSR